MAGAKLVFGGAVSVGGAGGVGSGRAVCGGGFARVCSPRGCLDGAWAVCGGCWGVLGRFGGQASAHW